MLVLRIDFDGPVRVAIHHGGQHLPNLNSTLCLRSFLNLIQVHHFSVILKLEVRNDLFGRKVIARNLTAIHDSHKWNYRR